MKLTIATSALALVLSSTGSSAFVAPTSSSFCRSSVAVRGYLDDLTNELNQVVEEVNPDEDSREATQMARKDVDRYSPGNWKDYVEFDEFDGGDGQVGVVGDGNKQLEKFGHDVQRTLAKSKIMSAKNSWGRSTGYAETLVEKGVDIQRAQQLENWMNQQELLDLAKQQKQMTEEFDQISKADDNWRVLSDYKSDRLQDFDFNEVLGPITAGDKIEDTLEFRGSMNMGAMNEILLRNEFIGFADYRAGFPEGTPREFSVTPTEGSMKHTEDSSFVVKFRPQKPGVVEGYLVIETEDFKKTWKLIGTTA